MSAVVIAALTPCALGQTLVYTASDMNNVRSNLAGTYVLMANIDLGGYANWTPIGSQSAPFTGSFDGNGYTITDINITQTGCPCEPDEDCACNYLGLFGAADGADFENVTIEDVQILGEHHLGALVGSAMDCMITNCYVGPDPLGTPSHSYVRGLRDVGGMVGRSEGSTIYQCTSALDARANGRWGGSLVGHAHLGTSIDSCNASGNVTGWFGLGGLSGNLHGAEASNSAASGTVSGLSQVGGLIGFVQDDTGTSLSNVVLDCTATGNVTCTSYYVIIEAGLIAAPSAGGLIAWVSSNSSVEGCTAMGLVTGFMPLDPEADSTSVGGLIGQTDFGATVSDCIATGDAVNAVNAGGLIGWARGNVENCIAGGDVSGVWEVGGLIGSADGIDVIGCHAHGAVAASGISGGGHQDPGHKIAAAGGLIGYTFPPLSTVSQCSASGDVTSSGQFTGGLVGLLWGTALSESYATGDVYCDDGRSGGLVGGIPTHSGTVNPHANNISTVTDCYAHGDVVWTYVMGNEGQVGGLIGVIEWTATVTNSVSRCYSTGYMNQIYPYAGGLIGAITLATIADSYWDQNTSGLMQSYGGAGRSTSQMQQLPSMLNPTYTGWDFTNIWDLDVGVDYPTLRW